MRTPVATLINNASTTISTPGWQARAIAIDNPGGQWVLLPDQDTTVPPWTLGVIVALGSATQQVRVSTVAPTGQLNTLRGNSATIVLDSEAQASSSGYPYAQNTTEQSSGVFSGGGTGPSPASVNFTIALTPVGVVAPYYINAADIVVGPGITTSPPTNWAGTLIDPLGVPIAFVGGNSGNGSSVAATPQSVIPRILFLPPRLYTVVANFSLQIFHSDGASFSLNNIALSAYLYASPAAP